jgi:hypothetical protein
MFNGLSLPRFTTDTAALDLDFITVIKDEPINDNIVHKSILNGAQRLVIKGSHWGFEVNVNLWKYDNPKAKYDEIFSFQYTMGKLQRHRDGSFIQDSSGNDVYFILTECVPYYLKAGYLADPNYDCMIVRFLSSEYVDLSKYGVPVIITQDGLNVNTEDDQNIVVEDNNALPEASGDLPLDGEGGGGGIGIIKH